MRDGFGDFLFRLAQHLLENTGSMTLSRGGAEPYSEYSEAGDAVVLTTELPGVKPEDIRVRVNSDDIEVEVEAVGYATVHATPPVKPREARILYKNGVLEVKVTKK